MNSKTDKTLGTRLHIRYTEIVCASLLTLVFTSEALALQKTLIASDGPVRMWLISTPHDTFSIHVSNSASTTYGVTYSIEVPGTIYVGRKAGLGVPPNSLIGVSTWLSADHAQSVRAEIVINSKRVRNASSDDPDADDSLRLDPADDSMQLDPEDDPFRNSPSRAYERSRQPYSAAAIRLRRVILEAQLREYQAAQRKLSNQPRQSSSETRSPNSDETASPSRSLRGSESRRDWRSKVDAETIVAAVRSVRNSPEPVEPYDDEVWQAFQRELDALETKPKNSDQELSRRLEKDRAGSLAERRLGGLRDIARQSEIESAEFEARRRQQRKEAWAESFYPRLKGSYAVKIKALASPPDSPESSDEWAEKHRDDIDEMAEDIWRGTVGNREEWVHEKIKMIQDNINGWGSAFLQESGIAADSRLEDIVKDLTLAE